MHILRLSLIAAAVTLIGGGISAFAQSIQGLPDNSADERPHSEFLLEPDAQIQGENIKQQTFRSQAAGKNKNWDLDIGRFQGKIDEDPNNSLYNHTIEDANRDTFSGMRLRLPFRGGTE